MIMLRLSSVSVFIIIAEFFLHGIRVYEYLTGLTDAGIVLFQELLVALELDKTHMEEFFEVESHLLVIFRVGGEEGLELGVVLFVPSDALDFLIVDD